MFTVLNLLFNIPVQPVGSIFKRLKSFNLQWRTNSPRLFRWLFIINVIQCLENPATCKIPHTKEVHSVGCHLFLVLVPSFRPKLPVVSLTSRPYVPLFLNVVPSPFGLSRRSTTIRVPLTSLTTVFQPIFSITLLIFLLFLHHKLLFIKLFYLYYVFYLILFM